MPPHLSGDPPHYHSDPSLAPACPQRGRTELIRSDQLGSGAGVHGPGGGAGSAHPPSLGEQGLGLCDRCQGDWPVPVQQHTHTPAHTHQICSCLNPQPAVAVASPISLKCRALGKLVDLCVCVNTVGGARGRGGGGGQVATNHSRTPPIHLLTAQEPRPMSS